MNWRKYVHRGARILCARFVGWVADGLEALHDWIVDDVANEHYAATGLDKVKTIDDLNKLGRGEL